MDLDMQFVAEPADIGEDQAFIQGNVQRIAVIQQFLSFRVEFRLTCRIGTDSSGVFRKQHSLLKCFPVFLQQGKQVCGIRTDIVDFTVRHLQFEGAVLPRQDRIIGIEIRPVGGLVFRFVPVGQRNAG